VLAADPELMLATDAGDTDTFAEWQRWPRIAANRYGNYFTIDADTSSRPTPRLLHAGREICDALETGRERRSASGQ
jgi:iron complex transport system substrate-binding protein